MSDEKLVPFDRGRRRPDPARVAEFAATARKLQQERANAGAVKSLLDELPREAWPQLAARPELRNSGALEELAKEVEARLDRDPGEALAIAELETRIADALDAAAYPAVIVAQLRAHAWRDRGQALSYLGRYEEAFAALDRAEEGLSAFGTLAHDRAMLQLVRAVTLQEVDRNEESLGLLSYCKHVFLDHGDQRRWLYVGFYEGTALHRTGHLHRARSTYFSLLDTARENDQNLLACIHNVIGYLSVEIGDYAAAESHLLNAVQTFTRLDKPLQAAKAELARGRLFVRRGQIARGVSHLRVIRATFLGHSLIEEAGLCGLEIVETLLARSPSDAEDLARQIVQEFTAARLNARAIAALGYLSEAIAAHTASSQTVVSVRDYIRALRKHPERDFIATA
jgi:tetratricopeptide (TPR) repeat protein